MKIIADIGSNFLEYSDLKTSVHLTQKAGADIYKLQWYCEQDLYGSGSAELNMPYTTIDRLSRECEAKGIEFMCTVFHPGLLAVLNKRVKRFKVASSDMCYAPLLKELNEIGKPVILSTGSHHRLEIHEALKRLSNCHVTLMYCVSEYPTSRIWLERILNMKYEFKVPVGLSDHSTDVFCIPEGASEIGATYLEKHFNPNEFISVDSRHSLSFDDFRDMVSNVRKEYKQDICATLGEKDMLLMHNRRHIALKDIKAGDVLKYGTNIALLRSRVRDTIGEHPFKDLSGHVATKDFKKGTGVYFGNPDMSTYRNYQEEILALGDERKS